VRFIGVGMEHKLWKLILQVYLYQYFYLVQPSGGI
jgi:hypothetical protein